MYLIWNRLRYVLSPQFDIYKQLSSMIRGKVADIGFGTGFGTHLLSRNSDEVFAYDVDEGAVRFAQDVFPLRNLNFQYGDISQGIEEKDFDFIVMVDVIEHLHHDVQCLQNVAKMLSWTGRFICSTPNRLSRYRKGENHVREYSPKELEDTLGAVFPVVSMRDYRMEPMTTIYENPIIAVCRK